MSIIAFRRWQVGAADGMLYPTGIGGLHPWTSERMVADCRSLAGQAQLGPHVAPETVCTCGLYARKLPVAACACREPDDEWHGAVGVVRLGGWLVEHDLGYRAQYAQILAFTDFTGRVNDSYTARRYPNLDSMWSEWAPDLEREVIPYWGGVWCDDRARMVAQMSAFARAFQEQFQERWQQTYSPPSVFGARRNGKTSFTESMRRDVEAACAAVTGVGEVVKGIVSAVEEFNEAFGPTSATGSAVSPRVPQYRDGRKRYESPYGPRKGRR